MEKLINAEALKELIESRIDYFRHVQQDISTICRIHSLQLVIKTIDKMKDYSEEVQCWIPCSERLPEKNKRYLVSIEDDEKRKCVRTLYFNNKHWVSDQIGVVFNEYKYSVIAWQPLPEPYKEV